MRVLMLTTGYGLAPGNLPMWNELAAGLIRAGHAVDVVSMDWPGEPNRPAQLLEGPSGERVLNVPAIVPSRLPLLAQRAAKWSITPLRARREFIRHLGSEQYEALITAMPTVLHAPLTRHVLKRGVIGILFIQDFFPIHHAEIGLIPRQLVASLKRIEEKMIAAFRIIYCNLPTNIDYLRHNYRLRRKDQLISWTPLWTRSYPIEPASGSDMRARYGLPQDRPIAVFGGQIIEGRGISGLLEVAELARSRGSNLHFLFVGSGRLSPLVENAAVRPGSNVSLIGTVPRGDYLRLLTACDVGMVATVEGVSSHSFPTKLIEYLHVGIPSVASVEPGSSFARMVVDAGVGFSVPFGDHTQYLTCLERAVRDQAFRAGVPQAARRMLDDVLDVRHLISKIERDLAAVQAKPTA
jgi:glycosyltransferase involved in cell wall biosynthesis